ncbi:MAG TPA: CotH kinase family protein [Bacteroidales bacterium]|nr:CotH kinase family protein [Bacteroidales bacterium]
MRRHFTILLLLFAFTACKERKEIFELSSKKEILYYKLEKELNPSLSETIEAEIIDSEIRLVIPELADRKALIASFEYEGKSVFVNEAEQVSGETANDFSQPFSYLVFAEDGSEKKFDIVISVLDKLKFGLPHIYINIDNGEEIISKEDYLKGNIRIDGKGEYNDYTGRLGIKGRGNTSWTAPKKPYRIKLDNKASLFGMHEYKDWILLAEYLDGTMLYNSIPYKAARLLGLPYTNHMLPVELTINGEYRGVYTFTEHKEVGEYRIDISKDGVLLELDTYFDEEWKFKSAKYDLPVMVQFPKEKDMTEEMLNDIKADFEVFESLVYDESFPYNEWLDYFDIHSFVNYMIVYQLTLNMEINHPKSTYINRPAGEKYHMGIIWDFDWGFGFEVKFKHYDLSTAALPLFWEQNTAGKTFFSRLMEDPVVKDLFAERWAWFKTNAYEELKDYVITCSVLIQNALPKDHEIWGKRGSSGDASTDLERVLEWLDARVAYIDTYVAGF